MAMNNMDSLADYMFEEMERLNEIDLDDESDEVLERLDAEIKRAKAMGNIAQNIVATGHTILEAKRFAADYVGIKADTTIPRMLEG